mmetsp:Transcript_68820/g.194240  ORF Transcript_68820/g.194240 Transcript_68820/m.194240 type:complete len:201 (-) Transcript_68820:292-894(-)
MPAARLAHERQPGLRRRHCATRAEVRRHRRHVQPPGLHVCQCACSGRGGGGSAGVGHAHGDLHSPRLQWAGMVAISRRLGRPRHGPAGSPSRHQFFRGRGGATAGGGDVGSASIGARPRRQGAGHGRPPAADARTHGVRVRPHQGRRPASGRAPAARPAPHGMVRLLPGARGRERGQHCAPAAAGTSGGRSRGLRGARVL